MCASVCQCVCMCVCASVYAPMCVLDKRDSMRVWSIRAKQDNDYPDLVNFN